MLYKSFISDERQYVPFMISSSFARRKKEKNNSIYLGSILLAINCMLWSFGVTGSPVKVELSCSEVTWQAASIDEVFEGGDCYRHGMAIVFTNEIER